MKCFSKNRCKNPIIFFLEYNFNKPISKTKLSNCFLHKQWGKVEGHKNKSFNFLIYGQFHGKVAFWYNLQWVKMYEDINSMVIFIISRSFKSVISSFNAKIYPSLHVTPYSYLKMTDFCTFCPSVFFFSQDIYNLRNKVLCYSEGQLAIRFHACPCDIHVKKLYLLHSSLWYLFEH